MLGREAGEGARDGWMDEGMDRWTGGQMDRWMKGWPGRWTNGHKLKLILAEAVPQEPYGCRSPFGCFFLRILGVPESLMAAPMAPHPSQVKVSSSTPNKGIFLRGVNWVEKQSTKRPRTPQKAPLSSMAGAPLAPGTSPDIRAAAGASVPEGSGWRWGGREEIWNP